MENKIIVTKENKDGFIGYTVKSNKGEFLAFTISNFNYTIGAAKEMYLNKGFLFSM